MPRRAAPKTNLPVERGAFIGRVKLLDEIARHIDGGARVVALVGPEGIGKTRLALRAAALELPRFGGRGGVWLIDGSAIDSAAALTRELLLVQGLLPEPGADVEVERRRATRALVEAGPALLLIDGLDRFGAGAADLGRVVAEAVELRLFLTSRDPLGVAEERAVKVSPLKLAKQAPQDARLMLQAEAVALFVERAAEAKRGFRPSPSEVNAIAKIVRQLDGVPLAIEIAAARLRALTASELLERLPRKVSLLIGASPSTTGSGGGVNTNSRARATLAGAVAWSLDLLPPWEQSALAQATVFRGGFDAAAASEILDLSAFPEAPTVATAVEALLEKALLRVHDKPHRWRDDEDRPDKAAHAVRLDMPAVVREIVEARLGDHAQRESLAHRHAAYYLRVCGTWAENVDGHGGLTLRRNLELETDNLVAAVRRALMADPQMLASIQTALRGVLALEPVLTTKGPHELFLDLLDRALEPAEIVGVPYALRAKGFEARGRARRARHDLGASLADLESALHCARRARDKLLEARALANIGTHYLIVDKIDLADKTYRNALLLLDEVGERRVYARALGFLGLLAHRRGHLDDAFARYQEAIVIHRDVGDRRWEGIHEGQLGAVLLEADRGEEARAHFKRALSIHRELANRRNEAIVLSWLGDLEASRSELDHAREFWEKALALHRQVGDPRGEATALARLGAMAMKRSLTSVGEELFLRARELIDRLDDISLTEMLAVLERRTPAKLAGSREPARAAGKIARRLTE